MTSTSSNTVRKLAFEMTQDGSMLRVKYVGEAKDKIAVLVRRDGHFDSDPLIFARNQTHVVELSAGVEVTLFRTGVTKTDEELGTFTGEAANASTADLVDEDTDVVVS